MESDVITRASHDLFGYTEYYDGTPLDMTSNEFKKYAIQLSASYDVIHVHSAFKLCKELREGNPRKKIILHHHGTDLSQTPFLYLLTFYKYVDEIITSTPDISKILDDKGVKNTLILNPVDTDIFKPDNQPKAKALYLSTRHIDTDKALDFYNLDIEVDVIDRETNYVPCYEMPNLLNKYTHYIDVKCPEWLDEPVQAYSKTGMEALACGLKVFNYKGVVVEGLRPEQQPQYMVERINKLY